MFPLFYLQPTPFPPFFPQSTYFHHVFYILYLSPRPKSWKDSPPSHFRKGENRVKIYGLGNIGKVLGELNNGMMKDCSAGIGSDPEWAHSEMMDECKVTQKQWEAGKQMKKQLMNENALANQPGGGGIFWPGGGPGASWVIARTERESCIGHPAGGRQRADRGDHGPYHGHNEILLWSHHPL